MKNTVRKGQYTVVLYIQTSQRSHTVEIIIDEDGIAVRDVQEKQSVHRFDAERLHQSYKRRCRKSAIENGHYRVMAGRVDSRNEIQPRGPGFVVGDVTRDFNLFRRFDSHPYRRVFVASASVLIIVEVTGAITFGQRLRTPVMSFANAKRRV